MYKATSTLKYFIYVYMVYQAFSKFSIRMNILMLARIEICKHNIYFHLTYLFTLVYNSQNVQMMYLGCFQRVHILNMYNLLFHSVNNKFAVPASLKNEIF